MPRAVVAIDRFVERLGRLISLAVFVMIGLITYEVIARYFFNAPTDWGQDVAGWIQVAYVFLGAGWVLQTGHFVRVDILHMNFPPKIKAWVDLSLTTLLFVCFSAVMILYGGDLALRSFEMGETSMTGTWGGRVYPAKFLVPIGTAILALAWLSHMIKQVLIIRGSGEGK